MSTITPLTSTPSLGSATDRRGGQQQSFGQRIIGEILKATVLESKGNHQYLLDFGSYKIPAASQTKLSVGQVLQLQISQTSPQVELKILSDASFLAGKSLVLLGNSIDLSSLFNTLQQGSPSPLSTLTSGAANTLSSYIPPELTSVISSKGGGEFLQQLVNRLGINFERLLAQGDTSRAKSTVKAALLEIASRFQNAELISEQTNKLLATLELYQLTQLQLTNSNLVIFPLPLPFLEQGYLLIDNSEKDGKDSSSPDDTEKFAVHLSMSELGNIQIDFIQKAEVLFIKLFFDSEEKAQFASQFSGMLEETLSSNSQLVISFSSGAENPTQALARKLLPAGQSFINTKA